MHTNQKLKQGPPNNYNVTALVEKLYPFEYSVNGPGLDAAIPSYLDELNFTVHEYSEGQELNGWQIPLSQKVIKAEIRKDGALIYDGCASPLGTILLCQPFEGRVDLNELKNHLFFHSENPEAIPFHCTQQYRPGKNTWGFCLPKTVFEKLEDGFYDIDIKVEFTPTTMKVMEFVLPGKVEDSIVLQAHNCHPFQANDDISGCAVGIRVFQELLKDNNRYYTYRLLICPELTGTLFWLHNTILKPENIKGAIILPAVGNSAAMRLQTSFSGNSALDNAAHKVLGTMFDEYEWGGFRKIYGNDETVFEAPGFSIPSISLTRYPFPTYHTNLDTPDQLSEHHLNVTVDLVLSIFNEVETGDKLGKSSIEVADKPDKITGNIEFTGKGLYCLSHPLYDLYKPVWDPSNRDGPKDRLQNRSWNILMTELPRRLDGTMSIQELSKLYDLPANEVEEYCHQWVEKGLATFVV